MAELVPGVEPISNPKIGTKAMDGVGALCDKDKNITLKMQDMPARSAPSLRPTGAKAPGGMQGHE